MADVAKRVRAHVIKIIGATITPRHVRRACGRLAARRRLEPGDYADPQRYESVDSHEAPLDAVLDFDKFVPDPSIPNPFYSPFNCGDGTHPTPRGHFEMAKSVRLDVFK
jgi:hypothetical protein